MSDPCPFCHIKPLPVVGPELVEIFGRRACITCATEALNKAASQVLITTSQSFDGYLVKEYIDIASAETVLGTGIFSELDAGLADFFGGRAQSFEGKLASAKKSALQKLRYAAVTAGGNAVLSIDIDYAVFSANQTAAIATGTIVKITPSSEGFREIEIDKTIPIKEKSISPPPFRTPSQPQVTITICKACKSYNKGDVQSCAKCGAPLEG